ncbi:hypothetical protein LCGC14_0903730 [marine sediment metagenome]|uniref:Uncharacterized protein n=1 Tax=marine sediment metagenome TaxID=412755 RepID=A0A0F9S2I2_9ZZZZ
MSFEFNEIPGKEPSLDEINKLGKEISIHFKSLKKKKKAEKKIWKKHFGGDRWTDEEMEATTKRQNK